jgi:hypothetical protein
MTRDVFTSFPREIILNYLATPRKKIGPDLPNILDEMVFVLFVPAWEYPIRINVTRVTCARSPQRLQKRHKLDYSLSS